MNYFESNVRRTEQNMKILILDSRVFHEYCTKIQIRYNFVNKWYHTKFMKLSYTFEIKSELKTSQSLSVKIYFLSFGGLIHISGIYVAGKYIYVMPRS